MDGTDINLNMKSELRESNAPIRFASGICDSYDDTGIVKNLCDYVINQLGGVSPDFAVVFASAPGHFSFSGIMPILHEHLSPRILIGCSGMGVIGDGREIEEGTGLSILAAAGGHDAVREFSFTDKEACGRDATPETMLRAIDIDPAEFKDGSMMIFIDPLTVSTEYSLSMLDSAYPHVRKFGGLVSGGLEYGDNRMFCDDQVKQQGAVGIMFNSRFNIDTIVSGCETPVGSPMVITASNRNVIHSLSNRSPLEVLEDISKQSNPKTRILISQTLVAGIESDIMSYPESGMYDFVMRNIMGIDQETGAIAIGDLVEDGQAFQFHVRDPQRAAGNLKDNLEGYVGKCVVENRPLDAALCFNSVTRGSRMFKQDNHDSKIIADHIGHTPVAGFFSNGEIVSRKGGFMTDEYVSRVMGYTDTLAMISTNRAEGQLDGTDAFHANDDLRWSKNRLTPFSPYASRDPQAPRSDRPSEASG